MNVHVVDGTYELFRHYYALPSARDADGREIAAVRGVVGSMRGMVREGATHIGIATDHVIESFRNGLWDGYKTGEGIAPDLFAQFPLLEEALVAAGFVVWPMVDVIDDHDTLSHGGLHSKIACCPCNSLPERGRPLAGLIGRLHAVASTYDERYALLSSSVSQSTMRGAHFTIAFIVA